MQQLYALKHFSTIIPSGPKKSKVMSLKKGKRLNQNTIFEINEDDFKEKSNFLKKVWQKISVAIKKRF